MSKVFITNKGSHDFSGASKFGEPVFLTDGEISKFNTSKMYRTLSPLLSNARESDYLLPTSMSVLSIIAAGFFIQRFGKVNILVYEAARNRYICRTINFSKGG